MDMVATYGQVRLIAALPLPTCPCVAGSRPPMIVAERNRVVTTRDERAADSESVDPRSSLKQLSCVA